MKTKLFFFLSVLILLSGCNQRFPNDKVEDSNEKEAIKKTLETMAMDFLKSWEPPFNPEGALSFFTQTEDFHLISDGHETSVPFNISKFQEATRDDLSRAQDVEWQVRVLDESSDKGRSR